jgi:hypothetical protein
MSGKRAKRKRKERPAAKVERFDGFVRGAIRREDLDPEKFAAEMRISLERARQIVATMESDEIWINSLYQVNVTHPSPDLTHLSIKRRDKEPVHDWRHLQWIKNLLVGPENEAVEIYPAESRIVDQANQYHLWVFTDPKYRIPFGFNEGRQIDYSEPMQSKQRQEMKPDM